MSVPKWFKWKWLVAGFAIGLTSLLLVAPLLAFSLTDADPTARITHFSVSSEGWGTSEVTVSYENFVWTRYAWISPPGYENGWEVYIDPQVDSPPLLDFYSCKWSADYPGKDFYSEGNLGGGTWIFKSRDKAEELCKRLVGKEITLKYWFAKKDFVIGCEPIKVKT